jgi:hypothetical protein
MIDQVGKSSDAKKQKTSPTKKHDSSKQPAQNVQAIKEQLKKVENALSKKKALAK